MFHGSSLMAFGTIDKVETDIKVVREGTERYYNIVKSRCNITDKMIRDAEKKQLDLYWFGDQATKLNIVTQLID